MLLLNAVLTVRAGGGRVARRQGLGGVHRRDDPGAERPRRAGGLPALGRVRPQEGRTDHQPGARRAGGRAPEPAQHRRASGAPARSARPTRPSPTPAARRSTGTRAGPGIWPVRVQDVLVLALDTATPASTAAVAEVTGDGMQGIAERRTVDPRAHGELLAPQIQETLDEAGVRAGGPGRDRRRARAGPVHRPAGRAGHRGEHGPGAGHPDVRRVLAGRARPGRRTGPGAGRHRRAAARGLLRDLSRTAGASPTRRWPSRPTCAVDADRAVGEGALKYSDVFGLPIDETLLYPPGAALVALAADRIRARRRRASRLTPLYLRRPDAVESAARKHVLHDADRAVPLVAHRRGAADRGGPVRRREVVGRDVLERAGAAALLPGRARRRRRCSGTPDWPSWTRDESWVQNIAVRRDAQRRGIGRALLEALLAEAARRGVRKTLLEVAVDNAARPAALRDVRFRAGRHPPRLLPTQQHRRPGDDEKCLTNPWSSGSRPPATRPASASSAATPCSPTRWRPVWSSTPGSAAWCPRWPAARTSRRWCRPCSARSTRRRSPSPTSTRSR